MLLLLPSALPAQDDWDWVPADYPPVYYKETPFGYEQLDSLPTIVVRDTVWVSDIDAFLKDYIDRETDINTLVKDVDTLRSLLDSLDVPGGERLYYNFFMRNDSLSRMSDSYIVREFRVNSELATQASAVREPESVADARRDILFRIDGSGRTLDFIHDKAAMREAISRVFTEMQNDTTGIGGISLYFPDYDFTHRRDMLQFVKAVRIMMDASRDFKFGEPPGCTPLHVFFPSGPERQRKYGAFICALTQEALSVVFLDGASPQGSFVRAREFADDDWDHAGLMLKIRSHFLIARYYTGDIDIRAGQITDFSEANIGEILEIDYPENRWETFILIAAVIVLGLLGIVALYRGNAAVSLFVNHHAESVLLVLTVIVLEIGVLLVTAFQNMSGEDRFSIIERHPIIIFLLPLAVVLAAPLLHYLLKNRKTP